MRHPNVKLLTLILFCIWVAGLEAQTVTDAEGNIYPVVAIGKQLWMAANLKSTKYNDGKQIQLVTGEKDWEALNSPAYCWFDNDIANKDIYGALYNWFAVNTKKLCPAGWHVPSDIEWGTMIAFLGDENTAGNKLKEAGTAHWKSTIPKATNDFGFTALPAGMRLISGIFPALGHSYAVWWSATGGPTDAWYRGLFFTSSRSYKGSEDVHSGFSVRCIKD